jgi:hypothetical protein
VTVQLQLEGEEYQKYVAKYDDTYSHWPSVPPGWLLSAAGINEGGPNDASWGWKFHGPEAKKQEVVNNIKEFLEGFDYQLS